MLLSDVDECSLMKGGGCEHECLNAFGSYRCQCRRGYRLAHDQRSCERVLEGCQVGNGGCQHDCHDQPDGGVVCSCRSGYQLEPDRKSCVESLNALALSRERVTCVSHRNDCHQLCMDFVSGEVQCRCLPGYQLDINDLHTCNDANECSKDNGGCAQICENTIGSFQCSCNTGYLLIYDQKTCEDINECVNNNAGCDHTCLNTPGSYQCMCEEGHTLAGDKHSCHDVNECMDNNGNCSQLCKNENGKRRCECFGGYVIAPDGRTCIAAMDSIRASSSNKCDAGQFGINCQFSCADCRNGARCNRRKSGCECLAGFTGMICDEKCPTGLWGIGCNSICACDGQTCDPITGDCLCPAGV
uniref:EGF-like domain-containing protein n=1 Tax=Plectus sambesii TaxID=2011161 RepID=A0A914UMG9_9BILA